MDFSNFLDFLPEVRSSDFRNLWISLRILTPKLWKHQIFLSWQFCGLKTGEFDISRILRVDDFSKWACFLPTGPFPEVVDCAKKFCCNKCVYLVVLRVVLWCFFLIGIPCIPLEISHWPDKKSDGWKTTQSFWVLVYFSSDFPFGCAFCLKICGFSTILKAMPMLASTVLGSPKGDREIQVGYMKVSYKLPNN